MAVVTVAGNTRGSPGTRACVREDEADRDEPLRAGLPGRPGVPLGAPHTRPSGATHPGRHWNG